ncbi:M56 family metallopeptidase [Desulfosporosinus shakirovi]|uniref:M56 family metallopeptidase n=1 Tax=Desulfosporosinus shakirovi TaxID=2885154 RepID=UPI00249DDCAB|nr:M56 family metallopeptidase [Desulfosporosinus sp. SRJS8]
MSFLLPVFQWVLNVSVMAGILTIVIILLKLLLGNKLNVKWHSWVWFLVIIRLLVPYAPETPFSVFNLGGFFSGAPNYTMSEQQINLIDNSRSAQNNGGNQPDLHNGVIGTTLPDSSGSPNSMNTHDFYLLLFCAIWLTGIAGFGFFDPGERKKVYTRTEKLPALRGRKNLSPLRLLSMQAGLVGQPGYPRNG